mgnify:CR=1 FL=1
MLQTFLPLFLMTFGICLFIVLMQFLWRYIDDMVGKGLGIPVLAEMFMYAALFLVPMALPLAILLASLMTFGNLGERLELLAMKSAGVSLIHIMRPLIVTLLFVSVGAFFFQNNVMPVVQVKLYTLLYSMRQKSPELDIPEGSFYKDIPGFNVYVKKKDPKDGLLKDVMIYDYSEGFNNARVIVADSGRLKTSADKLFLVLSLFNGESFENVGKSQANTTQARTAVPYRRESFSSKDILIEFDANFNRTDESFMQNQYMGKNLKDLQTSIDSMGIRLDSIKDVNAKSIYDASYVKTLKSLRAKKESEAEGQPDEQQEKLPVITPTIQLDFDSLYLAQAASSQAALLGRAKSSIENIKTDYYFRAATVGDEAYKVRRHLTEWHKKFTVSFACIMFFFIGAPLGAIIRKGGLGMPVVISVLIFVLYYIIDSGATRVAKSGEMNIVLGTWMSTIILAPLGGFLTYKSNKDSVVFNIDVYVNFFRKLFGIRVSRHVFKKEVIIHTPDYTRICQDLDKLCLECETYGENHKLLGPPNYYQVFTNNKHDDAIKEISLQMEGLVEEMSNTKDGVLLNLLNNYPFLSVKAHKSVSDNRWLNLLIGIIVPAGLLIWLNIWRYRVRLDKDLKTIVKNNCDIQERIKTTF